VLSDAGMGKSALLTMLKLMHMTQFWPQDRNCVLKKLGPQTLEEIQTIENKRKTILLLDSLDEDPSAYGQVRERLMEILKASQHFAKVIITCRTQFFPKTEQDPLELPGRVSIGGYSCYSKYLSFFDDEKVFQYLSKRFPTRFLGLMGNQKKIDEAQKIIDMMGSLRCRPMLLSYIEDLMKSPLIEKGDGEFRIYEALIHNWLRREKIKKKDISRKAIYDACIILAVVMQIRQKREISEAELDKLIGEIAVVKPITEIEMKGRSLLNLNSEGDYRFAHYSIQEFCVAKFLSKKPLFRPKAKIPVTNEIFQMIAASEEINPELVNLIQIDQLENGQIKFRKFGMEFVYILPGGFHLGSPEEKPDRNSDKTAKMSVLANVYLLQTTQVTQKQWEAVMGNNPSHFKGNVDRPVETVSWDDAQEFIKKLNEIEGTDKYRLPTEAEWENACRAGTTTDFFFGNDESKLGEYAWYGDNSEIKTHPVGQKKPNAWGLYDMHGNIWEWVEDDYHENYEGAPTDGRAWIDEPRGAYRVIRGGSWSSGARSCRAANRYGYRPGMRRNNLGFRLARSVALGS
jgi:formylglycine-generating enzyme required for sulfatase activity